MKRLFIGLLSFGLFATATAENWVGMQSQPILGTYKEMGGKKIGTRAEEYGDGFWFSYCGDYYQGIGTSTANVALEAAIEIPAELAQAWEGTQLTKMNIGLGTSSTLDVMIYLTYDLTGVPFYSENVTLEREEGWNEVTLKEPYTIDGTPFYAGYQIVTKRNTDFPIGVDGLGTYMNYGDWVGITNEFDHIGTMFGSVCLEIELSGNVPEYGALVSDLVMPQYVMVDGDFQGYFTLINIGSKDIADLSISATVGGVEMEEPRAEIYMGEDVVDASIPAGSYGYVLVSGLLSKEAGSGIPVEVNVDQLIGFNGVADVDYGPLKATVICAEELYERNVVVEEFTGISCVWCPRGIVGMKYMRDNYEEDGFIGIAVHVNVPSFDPMTVSNYLNVFNTFTDGGAPSCVMDRSLVFDPNAAALESYFIDQKNTPSPAQVEVKAVYDEDTQMINATATSKFAFDTQGAPYRLIFVIKEDNVGPYTQLNQYAGGANGAMGGWENLPYRATNTYFNEVARYIDADFGIPGSIPSTLTAGQSYEYDIELPTSNCTDVNNCTVVAMIVNTQTYQVMNAAQVKIGGDAGVENIIDDADGIYRVYNLQGVKVLETIDASQVNSLPSGIYIVNGKKILL